MVPKKSCGKGKSLEEDASEVSKETCCVSSEVDANPVAIKDPTKKAKEKVAGEEAPGSSNVL